MGFRKFFFWIFVLINNENNCYSLRPQLNTIRVCTIFLTLIRNNIPIKIKSIKILTHFIKKSENGNQKTVDGDYVKPV